MSENRSSRRRRYLGGCLGVFVLIVAGLAIFAGDTVRDLWGVISAYLERDAKHSYVGTSRDNLKALYTGIMLYHESEGQFPEAAGWMDAVKPYIKTNDLTDEEAMKKFVRPDSGGYGYGMNDSASAKYKGDLEKGTVLIFESSDTKWNAHGTPPSGVLGIQVDGGLTKP